MEEQTLDKLYYPIGEVAQILEESTTLVRFWAEKYPEFIKPKRNAKGNRLFTPSDVKNFKKIHHLVKELGLTLEGARLKMKAGSTDEKKTEVIEKLINIREDLKNVLEAL